MPRSGLYIFSTDPDPGLNKAHLKKLKLKKFLIFLTKLSATIYFHPVFLNINILKSKWKRTKIFFIWFWMLNSDSELLAQFGSGSIGYKIKFEENIVLKEKMS